MRTILLFSIPSFVIGQKSIPGYLGKKNCLSINYIGGIVKRDYLSTTDGYFSKKPNLQLTYERVLNRKKTILLSVSNGGFRVDNEYLFDLFDSEDNKSKKIEEIISKNFNLSPRGIRELLKLNKPIYQKTAAYGHFGRQPEDNGSFSWEKTDLIKYFQSKV